MSKDITIAERAAKAWRCTVALYRLRYVWTPVLVAFLCVQVGLWITIATATVIAAPLVAWRRLHRPSFTRWVGSRWAAWWRRVFIYGLRWRFWMNRTGLYLDTNNHNKAGGGWSSGKVFPGIVTTKWTPALDRLLVRIPAGFTPEVFMGAADAIACAAKAQECRIRIDAPGQIWLDLLRRDPLSAPVPALPIPSDVDVACPTIGVSEDGRPWQMRLTGAHTLIAGESGSGKGSVIWSLLRAIAPAIQTGLVRVWAIDPKGGMELEFGRNLFYRYERDQPAQMVELLEQAADAMASRAHTLRGLTRRFTASPTTPLNVVLLDEVASLTSYLPDRQLTRRVDAALCALLSKGRAPDSPSWQRCSHQLKTPSRAGICSPTASRCG